MISATSQFKAALAGPVQQHTGRITLHEAVTIDSLGNPTSPGDPEYVLAFEELGDLPVLGNPEITVDGNSMVMRSITFEVPISALLAPPSGSGLTALTPERLISGCEVSIHKGIIVSAAGTPLDYYVDPYVDPYGPTATAGITRLEVQVARLRITDVRLSVVPGRLSITAVDRAICLDEYPIDGTFTIPTPRTYLNSVYQLIADTVPSLGISIAGIPGTAGGFYNYSAGPYGISWSTALSNVTGPKAGTTLSGSRADAIESLTKSVGGILRNRPTGDFEVVPSPLGSSSDYVWAFESGQHGLLVEVEVDHTRGNSYNAVGATWSASDGSVSGRVFVYDDDPASPTYWNGTFGRRPRPDESLDLIETEAEAEVATAALLDVWKGRASGVSIKGVCNPLLLPGDSIKVSYPDRTKVGNPLKTAVHVIDSLTFPLVGGAMDITTREVRA